MTKITAMAYSLGFGMSPFFKNSNRHFLIITQAQSISSLLCQQSEVLTRWVAGSG